MGDPKPRASSEKTRPSLFWPLATIVVPLLGILARVDITDGHKLPREGAFVLAPNHMSEFDANGLANLSWAHAKAGKADLPLFNTLARVVERRLGKFTS